MAVAMAALLAAPVSAQTACADDTAIFQTGTGADAHLLTFHVEVADDTDERARGLMFRRTLPQGQGMLFIYDTPREVAFWMRNTLIPLDMIFLDAQGVIRHIHRNATPLDETPIPGADPGDADPDRLMILEIAGGEADRLGLSVGQPMAHPRLNPATARLSCGGVPSALPNTLPQPAH